MLIRRAGVALRRAWKLLPGLILVSETKTTWFFTVLNSLFWSGVGFFLGAYIHPILLTGFTSMSIYPFYLLQFKVQQYKRAAAYVLVWAITISITIALLTLVSPSLAEKAILSGTTYQEEMFQWIITGIGAEGDPSVFVPAHLINASVFALLSLATAGFLALFFGAYQMNYMNFYVGILLSRVTYPTLNNFILVSLLSWPVYAILRIFGFILIGVATTMPLASRVFKKKVDKKALVRFFFIGLILVGLDIVVKVLVAHYYQKFLHELVSVSQ